MRCSDKDHSLRSLVQVSILILLGFPCQPGAGDIDVLHTTRATQQIREGVFCLLSVHQSIRHVPSGVIAFLVAWRWMGLAPNDASSVPRSISVRFTAGETTCLVFSSCLQPFQVLRRILRVRFFGDVCGRFHVAVQSTPASRAARTCAPPADRSWLRSCSPWRERRKTSFTQFIRKNERMSHTTSKY